MPEVDAAKPSRAATKTLLYLTVAPLVCLVATGSTAAVLARIGIWTQFTALATLSLGILMGVHFARRLPIPVALWSPAHVGGIVTVAAGFTVWAGLTNAEEVIVRRDAASYFQTAIALATWNSTPFPVDEVVTDNELLSIPGVGLASAGFFQAGSLNEVMIEPQFLIGVTSWYSIGYWLAGPVGIWLAAALVGGFAVLATGAVFSQLLSPWAAVAATACTAFSFPMLHVSRSTYSEQFSLMIFMGGLSILAIAVAARADDDRVRLGLTAGLILGFATIFRIDAVREVALLMPVAAWLVIRRHAAGRQLFRGLGLGVVVGVCSWLILSPNYIVINLGAVLMALALLLITTVGSVLTILATRRGWVSLTPMRRRLLPFLSTTFVASTLLLLVSRPAWWVARGLNEGARLGQAREGLPSDPTRLYYEYSMTWTAWWVGWPTLMLAMASAIYLTHRATHVMLRPGAHDPWVGPFFVLLGSAVLVWARPGINPDHPWADRRLILLIPLTLGLALWLVTAISRRIKNQPRKWIARGAGACLVAAPVVAATSDHAFDRIGAGTLSAVEESCAHFTPRDVVLAVDEISALYWPQTLRGHCNVPVVTLDPELLATGDGIRKAHAARTEMVSRLNAVNRDLVVISAEPDELEKALAGTDTSAAKLLGHSTTMNDSTVTVRPSDPQPVRWLLYYGRVARQ